MSGSFAGFLERTRFDYSRCKKCGDMAYLGMRVIPVKDLGEWAMQRVIDKLHSGRNEVELEIAIDCLGEAEVRKRLEALR